MSTIHDANGVGIGSANPLPIKNIGSDIMMPVDVQSHYQQTIKTHNAVSVGASVWSLSSWIDANGFDKIGVTMINDASTASTLNVEWSNDGVSQHGGETIVASSTSNKSGITEIKARYVRVSILNSDTIAHVMSAWAFLKA